MKLFYIFTISLLCNLAVQAQTTLTLRLDSASGADAVIINSPSHEGAATENFGDEEHIAAFSWHEEEDDAWYTRTLLNFDWSSVPQGANIVNARLSLYADPALDNVDELHADDFQNNELFLKRIVKPWSEMEVTWEKQPATSDQNVKHVDSDYMTTGDLLGVDITDLVRDILEDPNNSHGIMMQLAQENEKRARILASSENDDQELAPKLEITYTKDTKSGGTLNLGDSKIRYWPNPVISNLNIMAKTAGLEEQHVRVFDLLGNMKYEGDFNYLNTLSIDASNWTEGVYLMQITAGGIKKSVRIYKR